jgi:transcriptional regulator with XRE-family HTH domain
MPALHEALPRRIRELRLARSLSQGELARAAGVSRQTISNIEREATRAPNLLILERLAGPLGVSIQELLHVRETATERQETLGAPDEVLLVRQVAHSDFVIDWSSPFPLTDDELAALSAVVTAQVVFFRTLRQGQ